MTSNSDRFYQDLPPFTQFSSLVDETHYAELPDDWYVALTDIQGSTKAIQEGRYKDVNTVGAASIMAILNAVRPLAIPYVFGGDGTTVCVPESTLLRVREAAVTSQRLAQEEFGLTLRVGIVPITDIRASGANVLTAKYHVSRYIYQAMFAGGGLSCAEELLKDPERGARYRIEQTDAVPRGDFTGLECRWKNIPSAHGEIICLLVVARAKTPHGTRGVYREVIERIEAVYGGADACHPVSRDKLSLTNDPRALAGELKVRSNGRGVWFRWLYSFWLALQVHVGRQLMRYGIRLGGTAWGTYPDALVANTDFRKFDDMLRMVLSGTAQQRDELVRFFQSRRQAGELCYGIHTAPASMITCLIFDYAGEHLHFVDGTEGGYAIAAKMLKEQLHQESA